MERRRKSSIHIEAGKVGYLKHNTRERPTANRIFDVPIEYDNDFKTAVALYRSELERRKEAYKARTGQKLQKSVITHLSAIMNLDERHTMEDVKKVAKLLEKTLGTKVFQIAIHRDEGWIDEETGKKYVNYHAHLEFLGLDEQGRSIRRKLDKKYLSTLQTAVAKILDMPRGRNYIAERAERPVRLDTYAYKRYAKAKYKHLQELRKLFRRKFRELQRELEQKTLRDKEELTKTIQEGKELLKEAQEILAKLKQKDEKLEKLAKAFAEMEQEAEERWDLKL